MKSLEYGHPSTLPERIEAHLRWPIVFLPLVLCIGLLILSWRNGHGLESFELQICRLHLQMLSERDQICFSISDEFAPIGLRSLGRVPLGVPTLPIWSDNYLDEAGAPERDDYSTYEITMHYHPFTEWGWGTYRGRGLKMLRICRPFGVNNTWQLFGWAIVLPSWWLSIPLMLPMIVWTFVRLARLGRRGGSEKSFIATSPK